ncbi:hypothetical protein M3P36_12355 [Altererythrobacter sp. KTW20L]|uniref:hypothetical protein n=1 Tax=Altererythrobacter sp. KTW20L TaxID=2942210 RepID=UPI0020BFEE49|nr:hypothetical protein [Altererythrobacter sp. KTW20L]MCL6251829.1 hypothetical protein [Altererythrobacter sp. KTW20L]
MGSTLAWIALAFALPLLAGFAFARLRPAMPAPFAAMLAAVPMLAAFGLLVAVLHASDSAAPFGTLAVVVFGSMALLCGFGLGMVGHLLGARRRK